jgi:hypothetical protein
MNVLAPRGEIEGEIAEELTRRRVVGEKVSVDEDGFHVILLPPSRSLYFLYGQVDQLFRVEGTSNLRTTQGLQFTVDWSSDGVANLKFLLSEC